MVDRRIADHCEVVVAQRHKFGRSGAELATDGHVGLHAIGFDPASKIGGYASVPVLRMLSRAHGAPFSLPPPVLPGNPNWPRGAPKDDEEATPPPRASDSVGFVGFPTLGTATPGLRAAMANAPSVPDTSPTLRGYQHMQKRLELGAFWASGRAVQVGPLGLGRLAAGAHVSPEAPIPTKAWVTGQAGPQGSVRWGLQASTNLGLLAEGMRASGGLKGMLNRPTTGAHVPAPRADSIGSGAESSPGGNEEDEDPPTPAVATASAPPPQGSALDMDKEAGTVRLGATGIGSVFTFGLGAP